MGKRGPKIKYDDEFHRVQRQLMREYRARLKQQAEHEKPDLLKKEEELMLCPIPK